MFSKQTKTSDSVPMSAMIAPTPTETPRKGPRVASLITEDMRIEGNLSGDGELHIDGFVRGDLKVARLTIGENGRVEGSITSEALDCRGRVVGAIIAREVRLYASSHVDGDVTHDELAIEAGAFFQGRAIKMQRNVTPQAVKLDQPVKVDQPVKLEEVPREAPAA
jgi:cytoskeletal protein CcmA (bactofilin family)